MAMAAKNNGGLVIVQVERIAEARLARSARRSGFRASWSTAWWWPSRNSTGRPTRMQYNPAFADEIRVPSSAWSRMPLDARKIIARRAAFELPPNGVVNLGIGMPEGVASVANEEKILRYITLTAEPGVIGGVPPRGLNFGAAVNTDAVIDQNQQFDFYDGGGLDLACLGMAECDAAGRRQRQPVRRQAHRRRRLHQHQPERPRRGLHRHLHRGRAAGRDRGRRAADRAGGPGAQVRRDVEQVTFSGTYAARAARPSSTSPSGASSASRREGLELIEIAPGIDLERDILAHMAFRRSSTSRS